MLSGIIQPGVLSTAVDLHHVHAQQTKEFSEWDCSSIAVTETAIVPLHSAEMHPGDDSKYSICDSIAYCPVPGLARLGLSKRVDLSRFKPQVADSCP